MNDDTQLTRHASSILKSYFNSSFQITKTSMGNANANFIVDYLNEKYFFRIYTSTFDKDFVRTRNDIEKELEVVNWFFEKGFPVAKPIPNLSGDNIAEDNALFGVLFEFLEGHHAYEKLTSKHFLEIGKLMGNVHTETEKAHLRCDKSWNDGSFWKRVFRKIEDNKSVLDDTELVERDKLKSIEIKLEAVPQYLIHGDYHFGNILFDAIDKLTGLLDFDDYRMGHFMDDAIRFFMCELIYTPSEYYQIKNEFVEAFWDGYLKSRTLSKQEIELIPIYMELHYLSGLITLRKKDYQKADEFKLEANKFKSMVAERLKFN